MNGKECIYKLSGLLSSLAAFVFEILIACSLCWRLWDFDNNVVQFVSFGLWEVYYPQEFNISGTLTKMLVYTPIDSTWNISTEFLYAQNLIVWAILMKPLVLLFSVMAIKISCMKDPLVEMQICCYKISALILSVSSVFTFVSVTWNHMVDLYGHTTLDFPSDFPVKKEALRSKHLTAVLPVGLLIATMSLFGVIMFLSEISYLKLQSPVKTKCASKTGTLEA
ncbi:Spermatogenesis-associated multipass transmembrane protein 1 [Apodemus speciosus]|uniref:Spermatogenesis-associated multipass transmembrane protein 1 n=1 Tax=Apodemus speciosus TaxID=105296 RepID=A0ABQ0FVI4_APOSI